MLNPQFAAGKHTHTHLSPSVSAAKWLHYNPLFLPSLWVRRHPLIRFPPPCRSHPNLVVIWKARESNVVRVLAKEVCRSSCCYNGEVFCQLTDNVACEHGLWFGFRGYNHVKSAGNWKGCIFSHSVSQDETWRWPVLGRNMLFLFSLYLDF